MEMLCKGISTDECYKAAIEKYFRELDDKKAESQAQRMPLRQALRVFKFIHGYGGKQTFHGNKEAVQIWESIKKQVMIHYLVWDIRDIPAEKLGEANLYAIDLMKETV